MQIRGRPKKYRIVRQEPRIIRFSPRGKAGKPETIELTTDEYETIRLIDFLGLNQIEAARSMHVSQPTLSRILKKARKTLANGLIKGTIIRIQGGYYVISSRQETLPKETL
jgi:predicted DNA-binding protein (UPF0251 family)